MKKNLVMKSILVVGVIAAICYYNLPQKTQESSVILMNIEALAADEDTQPMHCYFKGTVDCPINHEKVEFVYSGYGL